jgi:hypoxanthine-DNA glycosylase
MARILSFAPIANREARILILGSMPGRASLAAGQYYAHAQNLFWTILGDIAGVAPSMPYAARARALKACRIALWDVLASCAREGSLDSAIDEATARANDFAAFYRAHPQITHVFFNGAKAEGCYRRHVLPFLTAAPAQPGYRRLPSTSPANASISRTDRQWIWKRALRRALADG